MNNSSVPSDVLTHLEGKLRAMSQAMVSGNPLEVAHIYADDALLTDLKDSRVEGRQEIGRASCRERV